MITLPDLGAWQKLPFFDADWPQLAAKLNGETRKILPPRSQWFAAFELCPLSSTRVVILGQDPYPTPGHAHGLAFSAEPEVSPLPRSLANIYKEMEEDLGSRPPNGDLRFWARQGVLLVNSVLTVPSGEANGHKSLGWQPLLQQVIAATSLRPTAYILWGNQAQRLEKFIHPGDHLILKTAHPSPLSARRGFFGSRPFSAINTWLSARGETPINWTT